MKLENRGVSCHTSTRRLWIHSWSGGPNRLLGFGFQPTNPTSLVILCKYLELLYVCGLVISRASVSNGFVYVRVVNTCCVCKFHMPLKVTLFLHTNFGTSY